MHANAKRHVHIIITHKNTHTFIIANFDIKSCS